MLVPTPTGHRSNLRHHFVICNDPDTNGCVFIAPFSSVKEGDLQFDDACVVDKTEYIHLTKKSFVAYRHSKITTSEQIQDAISNGEYIVKDDLNGQTFLKVKAGIKKSRKIPRKMKSRWEKMSQ